MIFKFCSSKVPNKTKINKHIQPHEYHRAFSLNFYLSSHPQPITNGAKMEIKKPTALHPTPFPSLPC